MISHRYSGSWPKIKRVWLRGLEVHKTGVLEPIAEPTSMTSHTAAPFPGGTLGGPLWLQRGGWTRATPRKQLSGSIPSLRARCLCVYGTRLVSAPTPLCSPHRDTQWKGQELWPASPFSASSAAVSHCLSAVPTTPVPTAAACVDKELSPCFTNTSSQILLRLQGTWQLFLAPLADRR